MTTIPKEVFKEKSFIIFSFDEISWLLIGRKISLIPVSIKFWEDLLFSSVLIKHYL